eukprot:Skav203455  [mRNA]  locus=scaffold2237:69688:79535:- [translate_table: standard]
MRRFLFREWKKLGPTVLNQAAALGCCELKLTGARRPFFWGSQAPGTHRCGVGDPGAFPGRAPRIHQALDTAEELGKRFSQERLRELKREHETLQETLDVATRAYELRLRSVIDSQCPMHRALCIQELKHCELITLLYRRLVTLSEEEANWYLESKSRWMSEGKEARRRAERISGKEAEK